MTQPDEKELVLGNKQLISLFFVVAALCGVFFAMGYMIGRNSAKANLAATPDSAPAASAPVPRQQPAPPTQADAAAAQPDPSSASSAAPAPDPAAVTTKPALDAGALAPKEYAKEGPGSKVPSNVIEVVVPEAGASYLQVTALPRGDADNLIRTLRGQTFPAILAESPKDGYYRVLVGPFHQTAQVADAKNRLKTLGFADAFVLRK